MNDSACKCDVCKDMYTENYVVVEDEIIVYVCAACAEIAKDSFIWLCMSCGKSYIQPKQLVISRVKDLELKKAYMMCQDVQVIQGIDTCISCNPARIIQYMEMQCDGADC